MLLHPPPSELEALSVPFGSPGTAAVLKMCVGTGLRSCTLGVETLRQPSCPEVFSHCYCHKPPFAVAAFQAEHFQSPALDAAEIKLEVGKINRTHPSA